MAMRALIAGYLLLFIAVAVSAELSIPESPGADRSASIFDSGEWMVVQAVPAQFDNGGIHASVQLLKTIRPTGEDGVGGPLYSVNLLITANGRLLYSFAPLAIPERDVHRVEPVYYLDRRGVERGCPLEVRDVTGDGTPEILFCSGYGGASDWVTEIHVLKYVRSDPSRFQDVRGTRFTESWWQRFRWLDRGGASLAIVAEPIERSSDAPVACHACPKLHRYAVYRWDEARGGFVLGQTIPSTGTLHRAGEDPFRTDWRYITSKLQGRIKKGRPH